MIEPAPNLTAAFARLERRLVRRRLAAIEPILRFEIAALGAILASGVHIVPAPALAALAAGFGILLEVAGRVGCAAAFGLAWVRATPCAACDPPTRVLAAAAAPVRAIRLGAARWRRPGAFRA